MSAARLASHVVVSSILWRAQAAGVGVYVMRKGDQTAGQIIIRVNDLDGNNHLFVPAFSMSGERKWDSLEPMDDLSAQERLGREMSRDSDLWIIEIEDKQARSFLGEE